MEIPMTLGLRQFLMPLKKIEPDVVLPVDTVTIPLLSANRNLFSKLTCIVSLPCIDSFKIANNKGRLSQWLKQNQISSPPTLLVKKDDPEFDKSLSSFPFPALLKPCTGFGGEGIEIFQDKISFQNYCKRNSFSREFILQSFIKGYDLDCSILCDNGKILAFTIQKGFANGRGDFSRAAGDRFY